MFRFTSFFINCILLQLETLQIPFILTSLIDNREISILFHKNKHTKRVINPRYALKKLYHPNTFMTIINKVISTVKMSKLTQRRDPSPHLQLHLVTHLLLPLQQFRFHVQLFQSPIHVQMDG